jgi:hypothetical protein
MRYPKSPPVTEPIVVTVASHIPRSGSPRVSAIKRTSGGMGKKDDSANERINKAHVP